MIKDILNSQIQSYSERFSILVSIAFEQFDVLMQGLKKSVLHPLEFVGNQRNRQAANQDSSGRTRTHSLNDEALRR